MTGQSKAGPAPDHRDVLAAAVEGIHGSERPGQVEMADAIADSLDTAPQSGEGDGGIARTA